MSLVVLEVPGSVDAVHEVPGSSGCRIGVASLLSLVHWNSHWLVALVLEVSDSPVAAVLYVGTRLLWLLYCMYEAPVAAALHVPDSCGWCTECTMLLWLVYYMYPPEVPVLDVLGSCGWSPGEKILINSAW